MSDKTYILNKTRALEALEFLQMVGLLDSKTGTSELTTFKVKEASIIAYKNAFTGIDSKEEVVLLVKTGVPAQTQKAKLSKDLRVVYSRVRDCIGKDNIAKEASKADDQRTKCVADRAKTANFRIVKEDDYSNNPK